MSAKRPLAVIILAVSYIAIGAIGFVYHLTGFDVSQALRYDGVGIELVELLAVVSGAFMLRGQNWARWLAVAWIAGHVVLSAFDAWHGFLVHCLLLGVITWLLFRPEATRYFRGASY